ncbi:MAG: alpha/beta fold hydrolase [Nocardioides sp.]|nr:alpha/beta fold hydrolase [Nocardioides sp.]
MSTPARRALLPTALLALVTVLVGCSSADPGPASSPPAPSPTDITSAAPTPTDSPAPSTAPDAEPTGPTEPPAPAEPQEALPPVDNRTSLATLMRERPDGARPRILRTIETTDAFIRYAVTYRSGETTVSGVLLRPRGDGPFPGIVLNHGYIEPSIYVTGQGLAREQVALATDGFVVLHTDYRGHAAGDPPGGVERESRLGYTRDAVNAVDALEKLPYVDPDRMAMLGRSMGGGITMGALVAQPGLVDAAVIYASVSSDFRDNLRQFTEPGRPAAANDLYRRFGTPQESPGFYDALSTRTYFDRITEPVLSLHGSVDATCPPQWARDTQRAMKRAGVDSTLQFYEGEDHAFYDRWQDSMDRSIRFIRQQFRAA